MSSLNTPSAQVDLGLAFVSTDIGGTNVEGPAVWIDMSDFQKVMFAVETAAGYTDATAVLQVLQATDNAGAGSKNVSGKTLTLTAASKKGIIQVDAIDLDADNSFGFVAIDVSEAANTGVDEVVGYFLAAEPRIKETAKTSSDQAVLT